MGLFSHKARNQLCFKMLFDRSVRAAVLVELFAALLTAEFFRAWVLNEKPRAVEASALGVNLLFLVPGAVSGLAFCGYRSAVGGLQGMGH